MNWDTTSLPQTWSASVLFDLKIASTQRPEESEFAEGNLKIAGGLQSTLELYGFRLNGIFKYFTMQTEPGRDQDGSLNRGGRDTLTFEGWEVATSLSYGFSTGFFFTLFSAAQ